jgi:hypothetical protein
MPPIRAAPRAAAHPTSRPSRPPRRRPARTASRGQRRLGVALLGLLVASFAALLFVLYQLFAGAGPAPATARAGPALPANARRFNTLAEFEKARLSSGTPFAITLSEAELNQRLSAELAKQPNLPFRNVTARVLDDHVDFNGLAKAAGVELSSTVAIRFFAQSGKIGYEITSINFGPVPVPGIARQAIQDNVEQQLSSQKLTDQWVIDDIQTRVGAVTIVGHPK